MQTDCGEPQPARHIPTSRKPLYISLLHCLPLLLPRTAGLPDSAAGGAGGAEIGTGVGAGAGAGGVGGEIEGELQQLEMNNYLLLPFRPLLVAVRGRQPRFLRGNPRRESGQHTDQSSAYVGC